jgi:hypothetical protein
MHNIQDHVLEMMQQVDETSRKVRPWLITQRDKGKRKYKIQKRQISSLYA